MQNGGVLLMKKKEGMIDRKAVIKIDCYPLLVRFIETGLVKKEIIFSLNPSFVKHEV